MDTLTLDKKSNRKTSEKFWLHHYKQFQSMNVSKSNYAKQHSLIKHRFIYWCRKFENQSLTLPKEPGGFVPVTVKPQPSSTPTEIGPLCTLKLGNHHLFIHTEQCLKAGPPHELTKP